MYSNMEEPQQIQKKERYHHGDLRAQLVEATRQLVEEKGADHFSVSEACRVAGVSTAAPYRHFKDKDEMILAVTLEGMERKYQNMLDTVCKKPERTLSRIIALGQAYIRFARAEPGVFRLIFGNTKNHKMHEALMNQGPRHFEFVESEVAACLGKPEIDDDVRKRAFLLWTFVHGLSFLLIDEKVSISDMTLNVDLILAEIAQRVMTDAAPARPTP